MASLDGHSLTLVCIERVMVRSMTRLRTIPNPDALTPSALAAALQARPYTEHPALPGRKNHIRCGVLVPLRWNPEPEVIVTRRVQELKHGGEWCFPGGRPEEGDKDLFETACREGREELGLNDVALLGRLTSMPLGTSDYRIEPFVVQSHDTTLNPDPSEVAEVLALPLLEALAVVQTPGLPFDWDGAVHYSPLYPLGQRYLFGASAHTFRELIEVASSIVGLSPPRVVETDLTWEGIVKSARG